MTPKHIVAAVKMLKVKNFTGYDYLPQGILMGGIELLKDPLAVLIEKIYVTKNLPKQLLIAKTIPIHKKAIWQILQTIDQF